MKPLSRGWMAAWAALAAAMLAWMGCVRVRYKDPFAGAQRGGLAAAADADDAYAAAASGAGSGAGGAGMAGATGLGPVRLLHWILLLPCVLSVREREAGGCGKRGGGGGVLLRRVSCPLGSQVLAGGAFNTYYMQASETGVFSPVMGILAMVASDVATASIIAIILFLARGWSITRASVEAAGQCCQCRRVCGLAVHSRHCPAPCAEIRTVMFIVVA
jgi:hypothetical protein